MLGLKRNTYTVPLLVRLRHCCRRGDRKIERPRDVGQLQGSIIFWSQNDSNTYEHTVFVTACKKPTYASQSQSKMPVCKGELCAKFLSIPMEQLPISTEKESQASLRMQPLVSQLYSSGRPHIQDCLDITNRSGQVKKSKGGDVETIQQLKLLTVLLEVPSSTLSTHTVTHNNV